MNHFRLFLSAFSVAFNLLTICNAQSIPGELVVSEPTLAAACNCAVTGQCTCGQNCDCATVEKREPVSVLRSLRISDTSPITLAPSPDMPIQLAADRRVVQGFRRVLTGYSCDGRQCTPMYRYEPIHQAPQSMPPAPINKAVAPPQATTTIQRQRITLRAERRFAPVRRLLGR